MKTYEQLITPERAEEILRDNTSNRHLSARGVARMVEAMKNDDWKSNGESIKIGKSGRLLDGQHRLTAVVQSGCACKMLICEGVEDDVIDTIDIGRRRTFGDWLNIQGEAHYGLLSSSLTRLYVFQNYYQRSQYITGRVSNLKLMRYEQLEALLEANPDLRHSVQYVAKSEARHLFDRSCLAVLHLLFSRIDQLKCEEFFGALGSGANLREDHPVLLLRAVALRWKSNNAKPEAYELMTFIVRAWNAFVRGATILHLRFNSAEEFPGILSPQAAPKPVEKFSVVKNGKGKK